MAGKYGDGSKPRWIPKLKQGTYNPSKSYVENIKLLNDVIFNLQAEFEATPFDISFIMAIGISSKKSKVSVIRFIRSQGYIDNLLRVIKRLVLEGKTTGKSH